MVEGEVQARVKGEILEHEKVDPAPETHVVGWTLMRDQRQSLHFTL